jgi:regulation of enolase protein 1 (concanavalin A-like superfamily)
MTATSNRASIKLHDVEGLSRCGGTDQDGNYWRECFYGELEDSAIESWYNDEDNAGKDLSKFPQATVNRKLAPYFEQCCICHRRIAGDAWLCMGGGDMACDSHIKLLD